MKEIGRILFSLYLWTIISLITVFVSSLIVLSWPLTFLDRNRRLAHQLGIFWASSVMNVNPFWRVKRVGLRRICKDQGYVLAANHASLADIILLFTLNHQFKWLAKKNLFSIPFLGWSMAVMGYIPLERGRHGSIKKSYREALKWLGRNISILIFPEGTRSRSGQLSHFKSGAFRLALESQKPLLPVVLAGTQKVITKGKAGFGRPGVAYLSVLPPIETKGLSLNDEAALKKKVETLMRGELEKRNRMIARVNGQ